MVVGCAIGDDAEAAAAAGVSVVTGDTREFHWGTGTFASRSAVVGGHACLLAAEKVRAKAVEKGVELSDAAVRQAVLDSVRALTATIAAELGETASGSEHYGVLFTIGILNGFLPCGLVYMALAGSLAMGSAGGGAAYMFLFGLGTLPNLLAMGMFANQLKQ